MHEGVYIQMPGPNYETRAEVRMLQWLGGDAVGMSTVPEAIMARRGGAEVIGISCITNAAAGLSSGPLSHDDVTNTAKSVERPFAELILDLIDQSAFI